MDSIGVLLFTVLASFLALFLEIFRLRRHVQFAFTAVQEAMERRSANLGVVKKLIESSYPSETALISKISKMQKKLNNAEDISDVVKAENLLTETIADIFAFASANPSFVKESKFVKSNENLLKIEKKIEKLKENYNTRVNAYNAVFVLAPQKWVAKVFKFGSAEKW